MNDCHVLRPKRTISKISTAHLAKYDLASRRLSEARRNKVQVHAWMVVLAVWDSELVLSLIQGS
jgi:uncharacterized lipoprotein YddW (UPF0748 family)